MSNMSSEEVIAAAQKDRYISNEKWASGKQLMLSLYDVRMFVDDTGDLYFVDWEHLYACTEQGIVKYPYPCGRGGLTSVAIHENGLVIGQRHPGFCGEDVYLDKKVVNHGEEVGKFVSHLYTLRFPSESIRTIPADHWLVNLHPWLRRLDRYNRANEVEVKQKVDAWVEQRKARQVEMEYHQKVAQYTANSLEREIDAFERSTGNSGEAYVEHAWPGVEREGTLKSTQ